METATIPEMNKQLDQLSSYFTSRTQTFKTTISKHEGQFTEQDRIEFENLVEEIKKDAMDKINNFFNDKLTTRSTTYETEVHSL